MLPCSGCAYRSEIPGDCQIACDFDWLKHTSEFAALIEARKSTPERSDQWFRFPLNYDPVWGPDSCPFRAETRDPEKTTPANPLRQLLSMLR